MTGTVSGLLAALLVTCIANPASAQEQTAPTTTGSITPVLPETAAPAAPASGPQLPGAEQMLFLIRTSLLTLNDANKTGNYSVLRDLAAPQFQSQNSVDDLAAAFAGLRRMGLDLGAVALRNPEMRGGAKIGEHGVLRLAGVTPAVPAAARFELQFLPVDGQWRLVGIAISTGQPPGPQITPAAPKDTSATKAPEASSKDGKDARESPAPKE